MVIRNFLWPLAFLTARSANPLILLPQSIFILKKTNSQLSHDLQAQSLPDPILEDKAMKYSRPVVIRDADSDSDCAFRTTYPCASLCRTP